MSLSSSVDGRALAPAPVKVALSTASVYPLGCAEAFGIAAELGYDGVEVMIWTDPVSQDVAALHKLAEHYHLPVLAIHAPTLLITQRVWGKDPWDKLDRSCTMAHQLSADTVVAHPPFRWQRDYAEDFPGGIQRLVDKHDIVLAVENMYPWRAGQREMQAYLPGWDPLPHGYPHVTVDLSHSSTAGVCGFELSKNLGDRLSHLHLTDGSGSFKDEHLLPGRGNQKCVEVLNHIGTGANWVGGRWPGVVVLEVNTRKCRTRAERLAELAECLEFARRHLVEVPTTNPLTSDVAGSPPAIDLA